MDYNDFEDPAVSQAIRRDPNSADSRPEFAEVMARSARRLAHEIDPTFFLEPSEPFDLAAEVEAIRDVALTATPVLSTDSPGLLMFLHEHPDGDGPFDRQIWLEFMAAAKSETGRATDNPSAMAHALHTLLPHVMTTDRLIAATTRAQRDQAASGGAAPIDLNLATQDDRRRQAILLSDQGFHLHEYRGWPENAVG